MQQFDFIAAIFVLGGVGSALGIAADLRTHRQPMRIMNSVWVLTGLWANFFGLWAYFAFGRSPRNSSGKRADGGIYRKAGRGNTGKAQTAGMTDMRNAGMAGMDMKAIGDMDGNGMKDTTGMADMDMPGRPRWQSVVLSTLHCGAGCTLADIVGEWLLYFVPVAIGGSLLAGTWTVDYLLALVFGIGFQYAAIRGMERSLPRREAVRRAAKADVLSLTAWQAGMYGWMAVAIFALNGGIPLPRTSFAFWFMMQVAMACGFLVALPVNILLIRAGIKRDM